MALPESVATGTVEGTLLALDGAPIVGARIMFAPAPSRILAVEEPATILPGRVVAVTDDAGHYTATLIATDDDGIDPVDWTWSWVAEVPSTQWGPRPYGGVFELSAGQTLDITTVTDVPVSGGVAVPRPTSVIEIRETDPWPPTHESPDVLYVLTTG